MTKNIQELTKKITAARKWAEKYFNASEAENTNLFLNLSDGSLEAKLSRPSFFVEFPSPDTMLISPSIMGRQSGVVIMYRLAFRSDGTMAWNCLNARFPSLEIVE